MRLHVAIIMVLSMAGLSCKDNPGAPVLDPPGIEQEYFANYQSIQMCGGFSGIDWAPDNQLNNMTLIADYTWRIMVSVAESDLTGDDSIDFKFAADGSWDSGNFGSGGSPGQTAENGDNISVSITTGDAFYTFEFNDDDLSYTANPVIATGALNGSVSYDGAASPIPPEATLTVINPLGDRILWTVPATGNAFTFGALGDSLYRVAVTAEGYSTEIVDNIRLQNGSAAHIAVTLQELFGGIGGTVTFSDTPDPLPQVIVIATIHDDGTEAVRDTTTIDSAVYMLMGLDAGAYDLDFTAVGYVAGSLDSIVIAENEQSLGHDIELAATNAGIPDEPYFTPVIDGVIDDGWLPVVSDPAGDSNWGPNNDFTGLYVAWDASNLYLAVSGSFEGTNTVNIYLDRDFGEGTGVIDILDITDSSTVGNHLRKSINMSGVAGFGADLACSVWGSQWDIAVSNLADPTALVDATDWSSSTNSSFMEYAISWLDLYPDLGGGVMPLAKLGIYCVIGGGGEDDLSEDTLPAVPDVTAPDAVFTIDVHTGK